MDVDMILLLSTGSDVVKISPYAVAVLFIYAGAGKSSIFKKHMTTLKAKTTKRKLSFCQHRRKLNHRFKLIAPRDITEVSFRLVCLARPFSFLVVVS